MNTRDVTTTYDPREKVRGAISDLAKCRRAFGYGDSTLERAALDMLRLVPEHNIPEAAQEVKARMDSHVIDVALATLSVIGIDIVWPGTDRHTQARHACLASDLLDSRIGAEGASKLENTVRALLAKSQGGDGELLENFLACRRENVK